MPAAEKVWDGLATVLVPPSPKSHAHEVGASVEVSVNDTVTGAVPEVVDDENDAVGAVTVVVVTTTVADAEVEPPSFVAVSVTV